MNAILYLKAKLSRTTSAGTRGVPMHYISARRVLFLLPLLAFACPAQEVAAEIKTVWMDIRPYSSARSECSNLGLQTLSGSLSLLWVTVYFDPPQVNPDVVTNGFPKSWPEGLILEASFDPAGGFTEELMRRFNPYFVDNEKPQLDSLWKANPDTLGMTPAAGLNRFDFCIIPPIELAGHRIYFRATYHSKTLGTLVSKNTGRNCATILAPCSANDSIALMTSSILWTPFDSQALAVVDSMLAKGWKSGHALAAALGRAEKLGQYDRAMKYLDSLYTVDDSYSRTNVWGRDAASKQRSYEHQRSQILELKARQEEQQR
jgi:hypothetical protein